MSEIFGHLIPYIILIIFLVFGSVFLVAMYGGLKRQLKKLREKYNKELHFRKSSEIRLGKIGENLAPFVKGWPWDAKNFRFLGNPVDGIQFNEDELIFVEIKTGKARLSRVQRNFKDLVKAGKVSFATFKITEDGIKITRED